MEWGYSSTTDYAPYDSHGYHANVPVYYPGFYPPEAYHHGATAADMMSGRALTTVTHGQHMPIMTSQPLMDMNTHQQSYHNHGNNYSGYRGGRTDRNYSDNKNFTTPVVEEQRSKIPARFHKQRYE